jgi:hypothetical protein
VWQALHEELAPLGLSVITVAIDASLDAPAPYVRAAAATHPSLVDTEHIVADLYNMVNVPTVLWIDETGHIVRPNDVHYVSNEYSSYTKFHPRKPINALRAWVRGEASALSDELQGRSVDELVTMPTDTDQQARAAFALAWHLSKEGKTEAAERWFQRAGELAPHDFTIRRGSMPIRGIDASGPAFFEMRQAWAAAGNEYYKPLSDLKSTDDDFVAEPVPETDLGAIRAKDKSIREAYGRAHS